MTTAPVVLDLPDEAATEALARILSTVVRRGDVLALRGGLGAGKSVFARAFIRARTSPEEEVPSPTFTLVQTYDSAGDGVPIHHFDLYRLEQPEEAFELGIEDAMADGITLIEWPERLGPLLPGERLDITLIPGTRPTARRTVIEASPGWRARLKEARLAA